MGFLNRLKDLATPGKNPGQKLRMAFDPAGESIRTLTGADGLNGFIDPSGMLMKDKPGAAPDDAPSPASNPMSGYYGDPNDSEYGSFTKPFDVEEFYKYQDPGYWFRLQQGTQGLQNSAAAGSGALSGAALKDLMTFNQDSASQEYGNAFNRYQTQQGNIFSRLLSTAQLGQNAAAGVGASGTQLAGNAGQAISNAGTAAGSGIVGAGNALSQGATNYWLYNNPQLWRGSVSAGTT
jgi:hypothetical protein